MLKPRNTLLQRSVEDLADARDLRAVIRAALVEKPLNERSLRCAVWSFAGTERRAGVPPGIVINRLTNLIDSADIAPMSTRLALVRDVVLWCVEECFGQLGGDSLGTDSSRAVAGSPMHP